MGNGNVWIRPSTGVLWCISIALCISITILFMIVLESYKKGDKTVIQMLEDEDLNELVQKTRKKNISSKEMKDATNQLLSYLLGEEYTKEDLGPTMDFLYLESASLNYLKKMIQFWIILANNANQTTSKKQSLQYTQKKEDLILLMIPISDVVVLLVTDRLICTPQRPPNYQQSASFTPIPLASIAPQYISSTLKIPTQTMDHLQNNSLSHVRGSRLPTTTQENAPMPSIESVLEAPCYTKVSSSNMGSMFETPPFKRR
eukprot:TRINITY_DN2520_c0_g1_i6.p1 TRINITY_DN2520_c0_g1~~TRINITY_DN2520_c0_g1_i6.p1  ORF type:complete len:259 (+),score=22.76 TRINITY_DN2520_c0_g1_i6:49-825(+)